MSPWNLHGVICGKNKCYRRRNEIHGTEFSGIDESDNSNFAIQQNNFQIIKYFTRLITLRNKYTNSRKLNSNEKYIY